MRRPFLHLLFSLILLVSQQIGVAHLMSHGNDGASRSGIAGQLASGPVRKAAPAKLLADQSCQECLFLAQLGAALPGKLPVSKQAAIDSAAVSILPAGWQSCQSPSPFDSRAPPLA